MENSQNDRQFKTLSGFLIQVRDEKTSRFIGKLGAAAGFAKFACNTRAAMTHKG